MKRFHYKPIVDVVRESYLENAKEDILDNPEISYTSMRLLVDAADEEIADKMRKTVTDIRMWQLDQTEDIA